MPDPLAAERTRILARLDAEAARKRDRIRPARLRTMRDLVPEVLAGLVAAGVLSLVPGTALFGATLPQNGPEPPEWYPEPCPAIAPHSGPENGKYRHCIIHSRNQV